MLLVKLVKFQMCSPDAKAAYKHHCDIVTFDGEIKPKAPNQKPPRSHPQVRIHKKKLALTIQD